MANREFPPLPTNTWVFVTFVYNLKPGHTKSVRLMGHDLVLWRTQSGEFSLLDAYCSHMGAPLASGKVKGDSIECVFHKRCFKTDGACVGKGKGIKPYPLQIIDNVIFAWFGDTAPTWAMTDFFSFFPTLPPARWKQFRAKTINLNFPPKDLLENTVDGIHLKAFHDFCDSYQKIEVLENSSHTLNTIVVMKRKLPFNWDMEMTIEMENYGPCTLIVNGSIKIKESLAYYKLIFLCSPVEKDNTNFTLMLATCKEVQNSHIFKNIMQYFINHYAFYVQFREFKREADEVWSNKSYLHDPDLMESEKELHTVFRNWYSNFYVNANS